MDSSSWEPTDDFAGLGSEMEFKIYRREDSSCSGLTQKHVTGWVEYQTQWPEIQEMETANFEVLEITLRKHWLPVHTHKKCYP